METITFMTSLLTFYLKGEIRTEQNFLKLKMPNTLLTFIPLGAKKNSVPINQIADVSTNFKLILKNMLFGVIEIIFGFSLFGKSFLLGLLLLIIGSCTVINSFQTELDVRTSSGTVYRLFFLIFDKSKAGSAESAINAMISTRMNDTNTRMATEAQTAALTAAQTASTEALIGAINANNKKD